MKAGDLIGLVLLCCALGWLVGAWWADEHYSQHLDFGIPVLFGGMAGALIGGLVGVIVGAVLFT